MDEVRLHFAVWLLLAPLSFVIGCRAKVITDQELVSRFSAHEESFNALSKSYEAGEVICPSKDDQNICKLANSESLLPSLHGSDPVKDVYVKRNLGGDDGIWLPVQSYGAMSMSSSSRGYVYLKRPPSELISDTLEESRNGTHYRRLKGNWFLFSAQ
jgi:hypothetical protein